MPIRRIIEAVFCEAWKTWLTSAERPTEPSTAESASSTGTPAATTAPKASSRIRNVTGTVIRSALAKSRPTTSFTALSALAPPNSATVIRGCVRCTAATASSTGATCAGASSLGPARSNWTSVERPSFETTGAWTARTSGRCASVRWTSRTAAWRSAPPGSGPRDFTRDALGGGLVDVGVGEDLLGACRLAVRLLDVGQRARAECRPEDDGGDDDEQPAEGRAAGVIRAEAGGARGDVGRHAGFLRGRGHRLPRCRAGVPR